MRFFTFTCLALASAGAVAQPFGPVGLDWVADTRSTNQLDGLDSLIASDSGVTFAGGYRYRTSAAAGRMDGIFHSADRPGAAYIQFWVQGLLGGDATVRQIGVAGNESLVCGARQSSLGSADWEAYVGRKTQNDVVYASLNSPGSFRDEAVDMVQENGIIYALVQSDSGLGESTVRVMKVAANSMTLLSTNTYTIYPVTRPKKLLVQNGRFAIVGEAKGIGGGSLSFVFRLDENLNFLGKYEIPAGPGRESTMKDALMSPAGIVYFAGSVYPIGNPNAGDGYVAATYPNGVSWTQVYDGAAGLGDRFVGLSAKRSNGVPTQLFAMGSTDVGNGDRNFLVASYKTDGTPLWQNDAGQSSEDELNSAAVDRDGNPIGAGYSIAPGGSRQMSFVRFDQNNGNLLTSIDWGSANPGDDFANKLTTDSYGDIHIVGQGVPFGSETQGVIWRLCHPPIANPDSYTVSESSGMILPVLANDSGSRGGSSQVDVLPNHGTATAENDMIGYAPDPGFVGQDTFLYSVKRGPFTSQARVTVEVIRVIQSFTVAKNQLNGASSTVGTIAMSSAAGNGGDVVNVAASSPALLVPSTVTVAKGTRVKTFPIKAQSVVAPQIRYVTVSFNGRAMSQMFTLLPLAVSAFQFTPNPVVGGNVVSCRAVLNGVAGPNATLELTDNSDYCTPPASVPIPVGATQVVFDISTSGVPSQQLATVTGKIGISSKSSILKINP